MTPLKYSSRKCLCKEKWILFSILFFYLQNRVTCRPHNVSVPDSMLLCINRLPVVNLRLHAVPGRLSARKKESLGGLPYVPILLCNRMDGHFTFQLETSNLFSFFIYLWYDWPHLLQMFDTLKKRENMKLSTWEKCLKVPTGLSEFREITLS